MAFGRLALLSLLPGVLGGAIGCGTRAARLDQAKWQSAEAKWKADAPDAYRSWRQLDAGQAYGRAAHARLAEADRSYRHAIELLRAEQPGLRETLTRALALAPMDPALYLPFARACRERGSPVRAADFYRKFLRREPTSPEAAVARVELAALGAEVDLPDFGDAEPPDEAGAVVRPPGRVLAAAALGAGLGLLALMVVLARRRSVPLRELVRTRPELHQTVAYHLGCLRHEFLKHRIGAAGEALSALADGKVSAEQRRFLDERLRRGEPLLLAWRAHLRELERVLGLRGSLVGRDPLFRSAERALRVLERAARAGRPDRPGRVRQARQVLQRFDRELGALVAGLAYCPLDDAFLADVLGATRAEWASGKVELDDVRIGTVPDGVAVDVYRTDLRIVLKNLLRNAIAALAASSRPRRLAVDVLVELEATGEEVVRIRVRDSAAGPLAVSAAEAARVEHGLGIVQTALQRYDGSLEVAPAGEGYAKAVMVRLFRSQSLPGRVGEAA